MNGNEILAWNNHTQSKEIRMENETKWQHWQHGEAKTRRKPAKTAEHFHLKKAQRGANQ